MSGIENFVRTSKLIQKITSYTDAVKAEDLEKHMREISKQEDGLAMLVSTEKIMQSLHRWNNPQKTAELLKAIEQYPRAYKTILNTVFEYSKNGHEVFKELTPNMTDEQIFDYTLKETENYVLENNLSDDDIKLTMLSILSTIKTPFYLDEINKIYDLSIILDDKDPAQTFIITKNNDDFFIFQTGNKEGNICVRLEPKLIDRDTLMKIAEYAMKQQLNEKSDLSTDITTDNETRKILKAYIYIAIKYQGDVREIGEKELSMDSTEEPVNTNEQYNIYNNENIKEKETEDDFCL